MSSINNKLSSKAWKLSELFLYGRLMSRFTRITVPLASIIISIPVMLTIFVVRIIATRSVGNSPSIYIIGDDVALFVVLTVLALSTYIVYKYNVLRMRFTSNYGTVSLLYRIFVYPMKGFWSVFIWKDGTTLHIEITKIIKFFLSALGIALSTYLLIDVLHNLNPAYDALFGNLVPISYAVVLIYLVNFDVYGKKYGLIKTLLSLASILLISGTLILVNNSLIIPMYNMPYTKPLGIFLLTSSLFSLNYLIYYLYIYLPLKRMLNYSLKEIILKNSNLELCVVEKEHKKCKEKTKIKLGKYLINRFKMNYKLETIPNKSSEILDRQYENLILIMMAYYMSIFRGTLNGGVKDRDKCMTLAFWRMFNEITQLNLVFGSVDDEKKPMYSLLEECFKDKIIGISSSYSRGRLMSGIIRDIDQSIIRKVKIVSD